ALIAVRRHPQVFHDPVGAVGWCIATTLRLLQLIILRFSTHGEHENMTIGSTHNHPADLAIDPLLPTQPWAARFPNPPDLDYRRLIEQEAGCRTCHTLHSPHLHVGA
ncbi:hypothetical protein ACF8MH_12515, partial [Pseudomonas sp. YQ_13]